MGLKLKKNFKILSYIDMIYFFRDKKEEKRTKTYGMIMELNRILFLSRQLCFIVIIKVF